MSDTRRSAGRQTIRRDTENGRLCHARKSACVTDGPNPETGGTTPTGHNPRLHLLSPRKRVRFPSIDYARLKGPSRSCGVSHPGCDTDRRVGLTHACVCVQPHGARLTTPTTGRDETGTRRRECSRTHGGSPPPRPTTLHYTNTLTVPSRYFSSGKVPVPVPSRGHPGGGRGG